MCSFNDKINFSQKLLNKNRFDKIEIIAGTVEPKNRQLFQISFKFFEKIFTSTILAGS